MKGTLLELTRITRRNTHAANGNTNSSETVVASNQPSPRRPNTLDVEPAYRCEFHSQSGTMGTGTWALERGYWNGEGALEREGHF